MSKKLSIAAIAAAMVLPAIAIGQQASVKLKDGPGKDVVDAQCGMCHSVDYIQMNSPFMDQARWSAVITKMSTAFGATFTPADTQVIVDYLVKNYGA